MTSVWLYSLAVSNAVSLSCDGEGGSGGDCPAGEESVSGGCMGRGWAARIRRREAARAACAGPLLTPPPAPTPHASLLGAYIGLETCVGPRLEQRLDAGSVAAGILSCPPEPPSCFTLSRQVQRRPLVLPRRGSSPSHTRVSVGGGRVSGGCLRRM